MKFIFSSTIPSIKDFIDRSRINSDSESLNIKEILNWTKEAYWQFKVDQNVALIEIFEKQILKLDDKSENF